MATRRTLFLERYAARDLLGGDLRSIMRGLRLRWSTVDTWMRDPQFAEALEEIDRRRIAAAIRFAADLWPRVIQEQGSLAAGLPEPVPDISHRKPEEVPFLVAAYRARAARRLQMSTRAAEFLADVLGIRRARAGVVVHAEGTTVELFGALPQTEEELLAENRRLDEIFRRAEERAAAAALEVKVGEPDRD